MLAAGHRQGRMAASTNPADALTDCDMAWVCVGTPSKPDGGIDLDYVERCVREIGACLHATRARPLIVMRSTSLPGTTRHRVIPALEDASGLTVGKHVHVVFHPEFLREGTAVYDFDNPPKIVIGEAHPGAGDTLMKVYEGKYEAPCFRTELEVAEMVKYSDNLFHAVKVVFANEIGAIARAVGADARQVADIFVSDTKLNINPYYLRPGFAFGGSCLPKDMRAILRFAHIRSVKVPMFDAVMESNRTQVEDFVARVLAKRPNRVGMVGLAFKPDTDDMRESPYVAVAKRLIGEGVKLRIHDPGVDTSRLIGSNKEAVQATLGHLEPLLVNSLADLDECDLILINHPMVDADRVYAWLRRGVQVMDLADVEGVDRTTDGYEGIAW
jgi:GDP-mannose 6-dehydrogenase